MKKRLIYIFCCGIFLSYCTKKEYQNGEKDFRTIINSFVDKKIDNLYNCLGRPDNYNSLSFNKKNKLTLEYNYVYDFLNKQYECKIIFITNKKQDKIIDVNFTSNKCYLITMH